MKIQCDVCDKDEASIFCTADEAALCAACDHRVHHANKLAGKHQRFSLYHPSPKQIPLCDICQERRAFLFCQQDRAILCQDCDIQIHKANELTQKHTRFLLTGVNISATSTVYSPSSSSSPESSSSGLTKSSSSSDSASKIKPQNSKDNPPLCTPSIANSTIVESAPVTAPEDLNGTISASSISEYLIEMLPGWHFEDFLDSSPSCSYGFSQNQEKDMLPIIWDADLENNMSIFPTEQMGFWVPQVASALNQTQNQSTEMTTNGFREQSKEFASNNIKSSRERNEDNCFAVPQMIPSSTAFKRSRNFW